MPVVRKVSAKAGRYLVVPDIQPIFQIRIPKVLVACRNVPPLRVSLGAVSRREARRLADELAVMARRLFDEGKRKMETETHSNVGSPEWIDGIKNHLTAGLARLQDPPPPPPPLAAAAQHAIGHLVEIEKELKKGSAASPLIVANAARLRGVYNERLIALGLLDDALTQRTNDDALYRALGVINVEAAPTAATRASGAAVPTAASFPAVISPTPVPPSVAGPKPVAAAPEPTAPIMATVAPGQWRFSQMSQEYIDMRVDADGKDHPDIAYLRLRRQLFLELIGDLPVEQYNGKHLQDYVNLLQFWPSHAAERSELKGLSMRQIIDSNMDHHLAPLAKKTAQDGYVANLKTMMRHGMTIYGYRDPFANARIHWPPGFAASVPREDIDDEVMNEAFRLGVASGFLDLAMMPLLSALTTRRLGLLCYLQGQDIRQQWRKVRGSCSSTASGNGFR
jgi:hypothetical protein